jgi:hypothetical protein
LFNICVLEFIYFWKHHMPTLIKRQAFFEKRQKRQMRYDLLIASLGVIIEKNVFFYLREIHVSGYFFFCIFLCWKHMTCWNYSIRFDFLTFFGVGKRKWNIQCVNFCAEIAIFQVLGQNLRSQNSKITKNTKNYI